MEQAVRLCDFYHVILEQREGEFWVVTGILEPPKQLGDPLNAAIVARFKIDRQVPRELWTTTDYKKR